MRPTYLPRLVNDPLEDPALFIPLLFEKRALLFDMGNLNPLPPKELLKITHGFVTHTHMDHFAGFDGLLRLFLDRNKSLHLFGPARFLQNIEGKLAGYTWNLVTNRADGFLLTATEVHVDHTLTQVYPRKDAFRPQEPTQKGPFDGTLVKEPAFSVRAIHLDHQIPCLAFKLEERFHVNIMKDRLKGLNVPVGPWLRRFKEALYEGQDREKDFQILWEEKGRTKKASFVLADLARQIAHITPGQKIVYVVDVVFSSENAEKIIRFSRDADHLFIEAAFLHAEADLARKKYHLTAAQAGTLAREAGVKRFTLFHFSPRYGQCPHLLKQEALEAFGKAG
ncbi:MAG: ribonuclease Z [Thermodesulfobacteriota bacterium]|nr:ribonuclease Z [Thermodesulfobacteriota bacterium]